MREEQDNTKHQQKANGNGIDDDDVDEEGENLLIHQVFVFDHHSMHFLTCPSKFFTSKNRVEGKTTNDQKNR